MEDTIDIRSLTSEDLPAMHHAYVEAFSDYALNLRLNFDQFHQKFVERLDIQYEYSAGAFSEGKLVGFIYTGLGMYKQEMCAYNGGTGVMPAFRGKRLTMKMYQHIFAKLKGTEVRNYVLEVLTTNEKAIKAYEGIGFKNGTYFHCFKLTSAKRLSGLDEHTVKITDDFDHAWFEAFSDTSPSFQDTSKNLAKNLANVTIMIVKQNNEVAGYIIFETETGRISQMAVSKKHRRKGIGTALIAATYAHAGEKYLTLININTEAKEFMAFLKYTGFENQVDQYEMTLTIG